MKQQKRFVNWWEKTVEYAFVQAHMGELAKAIPLDGSQEQWWGDLITEEGCEFTLIEFKRDLDAVDDEFDKYSSLLPCPDIGRNHALLVSKKKAGLILMAGAMAHILVLGVEDETTQTMKLQLGWYWDPARNFVDIPKKEKMPKAAAKFFAEYTKELRLVRQSASQSTSAGGLVCATKNGTLTAAIDLESFQEIVLQREKKLTRTKTQEVAPPRSTRSRGYGH